MNPIIPIGLLVSACLLQAATAGSKPGPLPAGPEGVSGENLLNHIQILASDKFEGRGPGTAGEKLTVEYLIAQFKRLGLESGNPDGSYVQAVPLIGSRSTPNLSLKVNGSELPLAYPLDYVARSYRAQPEVVARNSEVVFAGYGIVAPEFGWDDFKDTDIRGKTVILIEGEPAAPDPHDPAKPDTTFFQGAVQTHYGTNAYKYAAAVLCGAAAVLIIHEPDTAFSSFSVVQNNFRQEAFDLTSASPDRHPAAIEGRITLEAFQRLCLAAKQDFPRLKLAAADKSFRAVTLPATATFSVHNEVREILSQNVVAKVTGSDPQLKDQVVIYTAHWDHLGRDAALPGDQIYNGAIDNAAGVAQLLEIAAAFVRSPQRPKRSLLFMATTAEEKGYLGARYYTTHPLFPLSLTLANINLDASNLWGRTSDVVNLGYGLTTLDEVLAETAASQQRTLVAEPFAGGSYFFVSDQVEFAKAGVPAVFPGTGSSYRGKSADYGDQKWSEYGAKHYHQVSDEVRSDWDLSGTVEDVQWLWLIGYRIAEAEHFPEWKPGAGFQRQR